MNSKLKQQAIEARNALQNHGVVSFPTETVMGLAVCYDDEIAYHRLNEIKRRPEEKPYTLMCAKVEDLASFGVINNKIQRIIDKFMPGSITILIKAKKGLPSWVTHGGDTIGLRIPTNEEALAVLNEIKKPLLVPSANRSGEKPALNSDEVKKVFQDEISIIVDGEAKLEKASTIVNLTGEQPVVVRPGPISIDEILKVWNY